MSKVISVAERIQKAQDLIQKARDLPAPTDLIWQDFTYTANVKDILRKAHDLVKFIQFMPNASAETKQQVSDLMQSIILTEKEILHKS